jgi:predicted nucleic acid-binding protein
LMNGSPPTVPTEITVSNSGPLIALANINSFQFLLSLFGEICITEAVYRESTRLEQLPAASAIRNTAWVKTFAVQDQLAVELLRIELDEGESETIVLARELNAAQILLDERRARRKTAQLGLRTIGTLGILLLAKSRGLLPTIKPHLDALRDYPFRIAPQLYEEVLKRAGES